MFNGDILGAVGLKFVDIGVHALDELLLVALARSSARMSKNTLFSYSMMASWMPPSAKALEGTIWPWYSSAKGSMPSRAAWAKSRLSTWS